MTQEELDRRIADLMVKAFSWGTGFGAALCMIGMAIGRAFA